ncbi:MAG: SsrA-binding protein SmpB [Candidatus Puniceispirillaceae bacterium]
MAGSHITTGRIAENRRARFDYEITDTIEAGIVLTGSEVKSLRTGRGTSIAESYAGEERGELALINANIPVYLQARDNHEPKRIRRLLVSRKEKNRLLGAIKRDGITLVPMALYFNDRGKAKIQIGIAKGRKKHDKREVVKQRDWSRQKQRLLRSS